jgi:RNA polymerase sigma-70 factor, ECF subfamily
LGLYTRVVQDALMDGASTEVERVYRAEAIKMWRALVGFTGDREIADDAVAEAFARALRHEGAIRDLRAWLWAVAFRVAASEMHSRQHQLEPSSAQAQEPADSLPDLVRALRLLPMNQRMAIVLHDYADRPTSEVASILGCARATVHVHLSRGRRRLRELLEVRDA